MESEELAAQIVPSKEVCHLLDDVYTSGFYAVARFISKHGGTLEDAKDIFQDAFVILHEQLQEGREIESPTRYITGIAKNLWFKALRMREHAVPLETLDLDVGEDTAFHEVRLLSFLERAGKRCLDILEAFYFRNENLRSLMQRFGFGSEHSASVQKYKCIEKLRDELKSRSLSYEDFFE